MLGLIRAQIRARPHHVAVEAADHIWTYAHVGRGLLDTHTLLRRANIRAGEVVAVRVDCTPRGIVAAWGVIAAGAVLLPLDDSQPPQHQQRIISDAGVRLVLDPPAGPDPDTDHTVHGPTVHDTGQPPRVLPAQAAYVLYTCGSTGKLTGVVCGRDALDNLAHAQRGIFAVAPGIAGIAPGDRVAQTAPHCADAWLFETMLAWTAGATVVVASPAQRQPGPPLTEFLTGATSEERVTVLLATPTTLRGLDPTRLTGLRLVISAGETLLPDLARAWAAGRRLVTAYGLTEGSIWSSYTDVDAASLDTRPWVPLGRPIPGCSLSLRTPTGDPVPAGSEGEVWIGGVGVAFAHYLNQPELTEQRFPHTPQGRMLRTGDYAVADPSGQLRYCGR